uniref:MARVEL domain-containing protein n=1 Tax=Callorhinchus milii TaxID=7868 RepID=A0A4W3J1Y1_CALMI|eukprot:gi/632944539/ref/XP_007887563.1/ PREDICTED: MARVEL domain-containing protein 3 [Callorhinchus milii]
MAQSTRHPEHSSDKYSVKDEKDHYPKERHRDHRHRDDRSRPSREHRKYPDHDSRSTQDGDHSKPKHNRDREKRREREKRHDDRNAHPREDRHRSERDYREREHREREHHRRDDHYNKPEREHHSQTYSRSADDNHQHYKNEKRVPFPDDHVSHRNDRSIATVPVEYVEAEDHTTPSEMHYFEPDYSEGILNFFKCRYLCTSRGLCQLVEVLLNLLILVCGAISYAGTGGYTDLSSLGSLYYYSFGSAYSGFQGAEAEKVNQLDAEFYRLKLPTVTATMAYSGALMTFACLLLVLGVARIPWRFPILLIIECGLDIVIGFAYIPALYFYFQHLIEGYNSAVCKERMSMYKSKGYDGFNCSLHGADIAAGLCAALAVIVYELNAFADILAFRTVKKLKGENKENYGV